jgi:hypothetical protein
MAICSSAQNATIFRMEYTILYNIDCGILEADVNRLISEGWKPQGGLALSPRGDGTDAVWGLTFAQAMVRRGVGG